MEDSYSRKPLFIDIDVNKCVLCEACMLICPNKALKFNKVENGVNITLKKKLCDKKCTKCMDICLFDAIHKKRKLLNVKKERKYFIKYDICKSCGKLIEKNNQNLCSKCKQKISAKQIFEYNKF